MRFDAVAFLLGLFSESHRSPNVPDLYDDLTPDDLPEEWRFLYEERIALMQPDKNPPLEHIEAAAFEDTLRRMREAGIDPRSMRI
jgi:hypothetical protein